jgi:predicted DCC family thiol-disulfide oxidoreductase YuxK
MELPPDKKIVLFDGICNLCNGAVQFAIRHDRYNRLLFTPLQGPVGKKLLAERAIDTSGVDSIVLVEPGVAYYTESAAALKIGQAFGGPWKLLGALEWIPAVIRDPLYRWIARNRYKWFGKKEACMVPTPALKAKFL